MIEIGFHTDAFNSSYWNFEQCLAWAQKNGVLSMECEGQGGPMIEKSLAWLRQVIHSVNQLKHEAGFA